MSWVGWLNFLVLQWLFVRLGQANDLKTGRRIRFFWVGPVLPMSGWWGRYVWLRGNEEKSQ